MKIPSTFLGTILLLTLASGARAATDYCTLTANDALRGCKPDAAGGYWVAVGKCDNIADAGDRRDCKDEASADKADELDLCNEQLAARLDACEHLGPDTYEPAIDPANFVSVIDNPFFPLVPGTTFISEGGGEHVEFAVTHNTKKILGVTCVEVHDTVTVGGELAEDTLDWFAQDRDGNVWYLGEDSSNFEHGRWVKDDGSWQAGVGNGQPGIIMLAHPHRGDAYRQEYSPGHAVDQAQVLGGGGAVKTPYRHFKRTLLTLEYSTIDKQYELKWHGRGVGVIKEQAITKSKELSRLVAIRR